MDAPDVPDVPLSSPLVVLAAAHPLSATTVTTAIAEMVFFMFSQTLAISQVRVERDRVTLGDLVPQRQFVPTCDPGGLDHVPDATVNEAEALALVVMAWNSRRAGEIRSKLRLPRAG